MSKTITLSILALSLYLLPASARGDFGFVLQTRWEAGSGEVRTLAFSPDGSWLVAAGDRQSLVIDLTGGVVKARGELRGPRKKALGAAVSPDGKRIALVDAAGAFYLFDSSSLAVMATVPHAHSGEARTVSFTTDGEYVLTGGEDGKVRAWTLQGQLFADLGKGMHHDKAVVMVAGVPPGRSAISVGEDRRVILWQVDTQQAVRPTMVEMDVRSAAVGSAGILALGLQDLSASLHRSVAFPGGRDMRGMSRDQRVIRPDVGGDADAQKIKATDTVRLIDAGNGTQMREMGSEDQDLDAVGVSPDGRFVATAGSGKSASVWDSATGKLVTRIPFDQPATSLAFSLDGKWMAAGTKGGAISLYRLSGVGPAVVKGPGGGQLMIILVEPANANGRGETPRVETPSLRVKGRIKASVPLKSLEVDGQEITSLVEGENGDWVFTAQIPLPDPGRHQVEVVAEDQAGTVARESFVVERARQVHFPQPGKGRRLALIVGVSKYADRSIDLQYADADAQGLYSFLTSPALGPAAFRPQDVQLLLNEQATVANITTGLREFLHKAREEDFVLFFFAGHGAADPNNLKELYLLAHDTSPKKIAGTGLLMRHVREAISDIEARDVLILTDACHSAGMASSKGMRNIADNAINQAFLERMLHSSGGMAILTASEAAQASLEDAKIRHGVFTEFLLRGLGGEADANKDHIVTLGELMEYVRDKVKTTTEGRQIPAIGPTSFDRQLPIAVVSPP
jgi:WD40 repeat protein